MRPKRLCLAVFSALLAGGAAPISLAQAPASPPAAQAAASMTEDEAYVFGLQAYAYFYPIITMDVTRRQVTNYARIGEVNFRGPANGFIHVREFPPADFRDVVRPNFDTLYSAAWLDLTREPMVLSLPDTSGPDGRYYLMPMLDMWSNVFASPGTRTTGKAAADYAIVAPGWNGTLPAGMQVIRATTPRAWVIGRTETNGTADYATVRRQQDRYGLVPLSRFGQPPQPVTGTVDAAVDMRTPPIETVNGMAPAEFYARGAALMKTDPPGAYDAPILARMRRIGIVPGEAFDMAQAPAPVRAGLERAGRDGVRSIVASLPMLGATKNTWLYLSNGMGVYGTDYLRRAAIAMVGLGANLPEDAVYPLTHVSADGRPLNGENRYVIRFAQGETPPVQAFWSITVYDPQGFQVANAINRFAIGDRDALRPGADGSTELLVQHEEPRAELRANWLPVPAGAFNLTMRLYYPQAQALDGRWSPPAVQVVAGQQGVPTGLRLP
jgi:hypothetical protein